MIIRYGSSKWRKVPAYLATTFVFQVAGHTTTDEKSLSQIPRLPMFPNQNMERTWMEYFRTVHQIIENHLEDIRMHKVK